MKKDDPGKRYSFEFDEQGTNEVSEQIMNAYNDGFIDRDFQQSLSNLNEGEKGVNLDIH